MRSVVVVVNGMFALEFALCALGIGFGDEVFVFSCTFIVIVSSVVMCGVILVVVDIDWYS